MATNTEWLASLGMSEYAQRFADNRIDDVSVLRDLTNQDLKDIGVPLEHRRKMLRVIAETVGAVHSNAIRNPSQSRLTTQSGATSSARLRSPRRTRSIKAMMSCKS